ncbi:hypothetical protein F4778DRAFT_315734 [Xylariomycetidae sp. FL2044]|nr:hypothetical protein F4778DRAFT_315734 [Xylariomycetidae sp. FL2044]
MKKSPSKAVALSKAHGLSIKTNLPPRDIPPCTIPKNHGIFAETMTAPADKLAYSLSDILHSGSALPKSSEALANPDWRNNRRHHVSEDEVTKPMRTVPPTKTEFSEEETRTRMDEYSKWKREQNCEVEAITEEPSQKGLRVGGYKENLNPDFITSAPATQSEFTRALYVTDSPTLNKLSDKIPDSEAVYDPSSWVNVSGFEPASSQSPRPMIRDPEWENLSELWRSPHKKHVMLSGSDGLNSATPKTGRETEVDTFPSAAIRAIKNGSRFRAQGWNDIKYDMNKQLARLEEPRTAGLPVEYMRQEYENGQKALAQKAVLDDMAVNSFPTNAGLRILALTRGTSESSRFDGLLKRMQEASSRRMKNYRSLLGSNKPPHLTHHGDSDADQGVGAQYGAGVDESSTKAKHRSPDSAVSSVSTDLHKLSSKLNPNALEFRSTHHQAGTTLNIPQAPRYDVQRPVENLRAQSNGSVVQFESLLGNYANISQDKVRELRDKLKEKLKEVDELVNDFPGGDLALTSSDQSHDAGLKSTNLASEVMHNGNGYAGQDGLAQGHYMNTARLPVNDYHNRPVLGAMASDEGLSAAHTPQLVRQLGQQRQIQQPQPFEHQLPGQHQFQQHQVEHAFQPVQGIQAPHHNGLSAPSPYPAMGFGTMNQQPAFQMPPIVQPGQTQYGPSPAATPATFPMPHGFGPKPVRKPKIANTEQQMQYEAYLEHKRATDRDFAMQCKERQARRAERQRVAPGNTKFVNRPQQTGY